MKKWVWGSFFVLSCSFACAQQPERIEELKGKVLLKQGSGVLTLSDGSCWKVVPVNKRRKTVKEWWDNEELIPKEYDCTAHNWRFGETLYLYPQEEPFPLNLSQVTNEKALRECTHFFVNQQRDEVLFAKELHLAECMNWIFNMAREEGYIEGFWVGYSEGISKSTEEGIAFSLDEIQKFSNTCSVRI